jgi:hypothetical protein
MGAPRGDGGTTLYDEYSSQPCFPPITFMTFPINIYRPKLGALSRRDSMVQRLWQKWSRF